MSTETTSSHPTIVSQVSSSDPKVAALQAPAGPVPTPAAPAVLAAAKPEGMALLLQELVTGDTTQRTKAAAALGQKTYVAAVPQLIVALKDSDADVAREAAASLGLLGSPTAVEALIEVVENHNGYFHSVVRVAAIQSLGEMRDVRAVESLLKAINDPIAETSEEAIRSLATLKDPRTLAALLEVVRNENSYFLPATRRAAVLALAQIGGTQADCEIRFVAENQWEDGTIRATALELLRERPTATVEV
jgi:HEAT repeat protein